MRDLHWYARNIGDSIRGLEDRHVVRLRLNTLRIIKIYFSVNEPMRWFVKINSMVLMV